MQRLTKERLNKLASRDGVNPEPVWNFVGSIPFDSTPVDNHMNLLMDARLYGWDQETMRAIRDGIEETFNTSIG